MILSNRISADVVKKIHPTTSKLCTIPLKYSALVLILPPRPFLAPFHNTLPPICAGTLEDKVNGRQAAGCPGNYRGVHLTAQLSKVVERLVLSLLQPFIHKNLHTGPNQFAYTRGRGARDAVALLATAWIAASNGRLKIEVYGSDVSGAFDKVDAEFLISKLRAMKVHPHMVKLLESWLRRRSGYVLVEGATSEEMVLEDMVFQGTVLGPQLWNIFFADAAESIQMTGHTEVVYADDLNAYKFYAASTENDDILREISACQRNLHEWGKANRVSFDAGKESSHVMSQHDPVGGECKILGISFDTKLTMRDAVADLVKECGWKKTALLRCKSYFSVPDLVSHWKSNVLSFIEYRTPGIFHAASSILEPVDRLQKSFLREIGLSEFDSFRLFRLAPLCMRRDIAMLGIIHRCVLGQGPPHFKQFVQPVAAGNRMHETRRSRRLHSLQVHSFIDGHQKELAKRSLLGMLDVYNLLPASIVEQCSSVSAFQSGLQRMALECALFGFEEWEHMFSSRHYLHVHPLLQLWNYEHRD